MKGQQLLNDALIALADAAAGRDELERIQRARRAREAIQRWGWALNAGDAVDPAAAPPRPEAFGVHPMPDPWPLGRYEALEAAAETPRPHLRFPVTAVIAVLMFNRRLPRPWRGPRPAGVPLLMTPADRRGLAYVALLAAMGGAAAGLAAFVARWPSL